MNLQQIANLILIRDFISNKISDFETDKQKINKIHSLRKVIDDLLISEIIDDSFSDKLKKPKPLIKKTKNENK